MEVSSSVARVIFILAKDSAGTLVFTAAPEHQDIADLYQIQEKLRDAYEGKDIYLAGEIRKTDFAATVISEHDDRGIMALSDDDFVMFCSALDIPYVEPK